MNRARLLALMMTAVMGMAIFSSCGAAAKPENEAREIRAEYLSAEKLVMTMDVTADYGDKLYEFRMRWTGGDELGELEILAPEAIRGVRAELTEKGGALKFDGAVFDTGGVFGDGVSPVEAAPLMIGAWKGGYIADCSHESVDGTPCAAVTTELQDGVRLRTWFDTATHLPLRAEVSEDGNTVLTAEFRDVITE